VFSELLNGCEYMNSVFCEIQACLPSEEQLQQLDDEAIENCIVFVCDIAIHFFKGFSQSILPQAKSLLLELFRVDIVLPSAHRHQCGCKVRDAWVQGLESLLASGLNGTHLHDTRFYHEIVERIMCEVCCSSITFDKIEHLSEAADVLWRTLLKYCEADGAKRQLNEREMEALKHSLCQPFDANKITSWQLSASFQRKVAFDSASECRLPDCQSSLLTSLGAVTFGARFLVRSSAAVNDNCETADVVEASCDGISVSLPGDEVEQSQEIDSDLSVLINIAAAVGICRVISNDMALSAGLAVDELKSLEQDLTVLVQRQSEYACRQLARLAFERSMSSGGVWSLSLDVVLGLLETNTVETVLPADAEVFVPLTASVVSTLNVILSRMPRDFVVHFANVLVAMLMSCSTECIASYQSKFDGKCEVLFWTVVFESCLKPFF
jgi:hypothetical protein